MKRKILIVTPTMAKGGAERVVSILTNSLAKKGYNISLVVLRLNKQAYNITKDVEIIPLTRGKRTSNLLNRAYFAIITFIRFVLLVKKKSPNYVISFTTSANIWTGIVSNLFGLPYIISERTAPDRTINSLNPFSKKLVYELYKRSEALVVPSQGILQNLKESRHFDALKNVIIVNNPISTFENLTPARVHTRRFILSVGRLHKVKGFDRLIEAFKRINTSDIDLIIAGEGREREELATQIKNSGLQDRVFLPGNKENIQDYYQQCTLFVLSSRNEGYPNALIEAMSFGSPSIAFDCDFGPREIIESGKNGLLIPNNNIPLLSQAIDALLVDSVLRSKLAENAKAVSISNSAKAIMSRWEELINND